MLPEELHGEWTPTRILDLFGGSGSNSGSGSGSNLPGDDIVTKQRTRQILCDILNRLNNLPATRIAEVKLILGVAIRFGDNSAVELKANEGTKFLNAYIEDRDQMVAIMEYNRAGDPRVTGEFDRLQRIETNADQALSILRRVLNEDCDTPEIREAIQYLEKIA